MNETDERVNMFLLHPSRWRPCFHINHENEDINVNVNININISLSCPDLKATIQQ